MSEIALATKIRVFKGNTDLFKWQNFFVNQTVDGFEHYPFMTSSAVVNRTASEGGFAIQLALTQANLTYFEAAINEQFLIEVEMYELPIAAVTAADFSTATRVARFIGETMQMSCTMEGISVEFGSTIFAFRGDIPSRKYTTSLVGRLPFF